MYQKFLSLCRVFCLKLACLIKNVLSKKTSRRKKTTGSRFGDFFIDPLNEVYIPLVTSEITELSVTASHVLNV